MTQEQIIIKGLSRSVIIDGLQAGGLDAEWCRCCSDVAIDPLSINKHNIGQTRYNWCEDCAKIEGVETIKKLLKKKGYINISKDEAIRWLKLDCGLDIRCQEVDAANRSPHDKDFVGLDPADLGDDGEFPDEWQTFQIWG